MAKRWQKEDLAYLKRYGKTKSIDELAVRFKTDGQELERVGITYVLQKSDSRWKIAVLIAHA